MREHRTGQTYPVLGTLLQEVRHALRGLRRSAAFPIASAAMFACDWQWSAQNDLLARLSRGLRSAFWQLGGVPLLHRTDSMTAAINNLVVWFKRGIRHTRVVRRRSCYLTGSENTYKAFPFPGW